MTHSGSNDHDDYLAVAIQAIASSGATGALDELGWWELLDHLDDPDSRTAVFAVFRAQGAALADSVALGGIIAHPYLEEIGTPSASVVSTIARNHARLGMVHVVVGEPAGRHLLVDQPGLGAALIDPEQIEMRPIAVAGGMTLNELVIDSSTFVAAIPESVAAAARARSARLGRIAIAAEILGAAERALEVAAGYAADRAQFGRPIGTFQAIRHLLAWGRTECVAVASVLATAVHLHTAAPANYDVVLKALAGRNGRQVCQRALQVLGGIGFTEEHDHHRFHSRTLALDGLLGSSAELTHQLGAQVRTAGELWSRGAMFGSAAPR